MAKRGHSLVEGSAAAVGYHGGEEAVGGLITIRSVALPSLVIARLVLLFVYALFRCWKLGTMPI